MKTIRSLSRTLIFSIVALVTTIPTWGANKTWAAAASAIFWSNDTNWSPEGAPGASDNVTFNATGATDTPLSLGGTLTSEVDTPFTINSLGFRNIVGVHNVGLTQPLVVSGTSSTDVAFIADDGQPAVFFVGSGQQDGATDVVYTSIAGESLTINNPNANLSVMQGSITAGAHWATLDLSTLSSFTCTVSNVLVAHDFGIPVMRPNGTLILGANNTITAKMISISDAYQNAGSGGAGSLLKLGQDNVLNIDRIRIGSHKCVGTLSFREDLAVPFTVKFRDHSGTGRQTSWELGDEYEPDESLGYFTSGQAIGYIDLTGGTVDALVDRIVLGRGQTNAPTRNGDGNGTLTFGGGTINANTILMGIQLSGGGSAGRGKLNVNNDDGANPATLIVNDNIVMTEQLPGNTEPTGSTAELTINGGKVSVGGDIIDGGGTATITISNGGTLTVGTRDDLPTPGDIAVDVIVLDGGTLADFATLSVSTLTLIGGSEFRVEADQTLIAAQSGAIGDLTVTGDLTLRGTLELDIRKNDGTRTSDKVVVSGTASFGGTLKVTSSGNTPLALGDKFVLFTAGAFANSFTSLSLPSPGPGLGWQNNLTTDGSIEVIASGEPTERPRLTFSTTATGITLSWPEAYTSYVLRGQTNPVTIGLSNNWGPVEGVAGNRVTIERNAANGTVFFQLIQQ